MESKTRQCFQGPDVSQESARSFLHTDGQITAGVFGVGVVVEALYRESWSTCFIAETLCPLLQCARFHGGGATPQDICTNGYEAVGAHRDNERVRTSAVLEHFHLSFGKYPDAFTGQYAGGDDERKLT